MLQALRNRMRDREGGFTLIELMVVVLIIAILLAIAIPTFLGARERAQDRAAQSDLRNALTAGKVLYTDTESYDVTVAQLDGVEPSLDFVESVAAADVDTDTVGYVHAADGSDVVFVTESEAGDFFCIAEDEDTGTTYNSGTLASVDSAAECNQASW